MGVGDRLAEEWPEELTPERLQELGKEVCRVTHLLARVREDASPSPVTAEAVRATIRARRLRESYFSADLFADPAWDMMLDLFAARLEGKPVSVSSLCTAAGVPPTTALRWIGLLEKRGHFTRSADPKDGRRVLVGLTDNAARQIEAALTEAQAASKLLM